ncbi:amino acid ABC transporter permease [Microaerobacter geothermalis]|uniref:amino acid ABC transporter permease n=1 Tax=Microaerobacter geothermalis TaxID=674972 RepID=UPI001F401C68|nr:amino acid ABC transporter permease [Microaerobacter geothermalis]MCF6093864.1 amino acid ABC transporter permease [Microaerobacter geothermalis]
MTFDVPFMIDQIPRFIDGALMTLAVGLIVMITSTVIGFINATILFFRWKGIRIFIRWYVEFSRNTPLLVQIFFLFFALPSLGIKMSPFTTAIVGMTFLGGGYTTEIFRSGIEAVPRGQIEAGLALGMSKWQTYCFVVIPQALKIAMAAFIGNVIFLLKETSIVSAIGVQELLYTATDIIATYYKTFEMFALLALSYLFLILPLSALLSMVERRVNREQFAD